MTKQVKTVTHQPLMPIKTDTTQQQLLDELHYQQSRQVITKLLNKGLISEKRIQANRSIKSTIFSAFNRARKR